MRVALVSGYDWSVPGGAQGQVAAIAGALAVRGESVAVVAPNRLAGGGPRIPGVQLFVAGRSLDVSVNGSVAPIAPTPVAAWTTMRALRAFSPEVVHVHEPLLPGPPLAAALLGPRPVVATFHRAGADSLYRLEGAALGQLVRRRLAAVTSVSGEAATTARAVLGRGLRDVVEVPNGVELERFSSARRRLEARETTGGGGGRGREGRWKDPGGPVVAFVGRFERRKGVTLLASAVGAVDGRARVVIVGDGPEAPSVRRALGDDARVQLPGRVGDDEVAEVMASADVFVAPATSGESFGVVILEAMAAGAAVVASDIPGYLAAAGGAARHFRAGDGRALAAAVNEVVEDDVLRSALVARGTTRARECSIEIVAERYLEVYRSVLGVRLA